MVKLFRKKNIKKYPTILFSLLTAGFLFFALLPNVEQGNWGYTNEELFLRGNKYYREKNYEDALQNYLMITQKGPAVLYNIGNCLFHKEDYSHALVYWLRAEKGATAHEYSLIAHNKNLVLKKLNKQKENDVVQKIVEFLRLKFSYISWLFLQLFFLICWWLLFIRIRRKEKESKKLIQSLLSVCIIIFIIIVSDWYIQQQAYTAIIVKKEAKLFAGPDTNFPVLSPLVYAEGAKIKEVRQGWCKIQYTDMLGWVEEDVIQII